MPVAIRAQIFALIRWALLLLLLLPVTFLMTFLLMPLWRSVEARFQIESVGHSGPAEWCFIAVYVAALTIAVLAWLVRRKKRARPR